MNGSVPLAFAVLSGFEVVFGGRSCSPFVPPVGAVVVPVGAVVVPVGAAVVVPVVAVVVVPPYCTSFGVIANAV